MTVRLAAIADVHFDPAAQENDPRAKDIADILLLRAVHYINRFIRPDAVALLGDLLDDGAACQAAQYRASLAEIINLLEAPCIVLPGNHDDDPAAFAADMGRPPKWLDVDGARLVPFVDPPEPDYNARRLEADIRRIEAARLGFAGPLVALHHVPVFPPGQVDCPYNYVNAPEVWAAMRRAGATLALAGHYHRGFEMLRRAEPSSIAVPALCAFPHPIMEIAIDGERIDTRIHDLAVDPALSLIDRHVHTPLAYCNENMDFERVRALAPRLGLAGVGLAEHADQLYYGPRLFREMNYIRKGMKAVRPDCRRVDTYLESARRAGYAPERIGFEVDCDFRGEMAIDRADADQAGFLIGAMHDLPELLDGARDPERAGDQFLDLLGRFAGQGIDILAHPFRVFRRGGVAAPRRLYEPTVEILRRHGIAAELNFHTNDPPAEFVAMCVERGVKLVLGSDSHNLYEVGFFAPQLRLLDDLGLLGRLDEVLWDRARVLEMRAETT